MKTTFISKLQQFWSANRLSLSTIFGVLLGLASGLSVKALFLPADTPLDPNLLRYLSLPGLLFIRLFLILIVPLLITSLATSFISACGDADDETRSEVISTKKLLLLTFAFFICCTTFAAVLGITLGALFRPGASSTAVSPPVMIENNATMLDEIALKQKRIEQEFYQSDSVYQILLNLLPDNLLSALFLSSYTTTEIVWPVNRLAILEPTFVPTIRSKTSHSFKANMLGVCTLSILLGLLLQQLGAKKMATVLQLLQELALLVGQSMSCLLRLMPIGMFCLMFTEALKMEHSIGEVAVQLAKLYALTLIGFAVILLVFYPLLYFLFTRANPFRLYNRILPAILIALGSSSSAMTLPVTMRCMEESAGLAKSIVQSVLPLGMTLNMNGTALYFPLVALFVAQMKAVQVDLFSMVILGVFTVVTAMGFPGAPGGGSIVIHITFAAVIGIDDAGDVLAYILALEWAIERIRTAINIIGDCFVAKCIEQLVIPARKRGPLPVWNDIECNNGQMTQC